jgi:UDP-glucose 4-epimerase
LGGKGFIGSHLVEALLNAGHAVRVFDRPEAAALNTPAIRAHVDWCDGDIARPEDVGRALTDRDVCFHLVSTTLPKSSNADPVFDLESNLIATVRLLNQAVRAGLKKIVFVSSGGTVYGTPQHVPIAEDHPTHPISSYGITKLAIEKYLHLFQTLHGLSYVVLRPSNPFGERQRANASQGAVAVFMGKVLRGEPVEIWGDGSVVRDYLYIGDLAAAMVAAGRYEGPERVFNIGSGAGQSLNQVLDGIEQVTGKKAIRRYMDARAFDVPTNVLDISRAQRALGWSPAVSFLDGLARTARWMTANPS